MVTRPTEETQTTGSSSSSTAKPNTTTTFTTNSNIRARGHWRRLCRRVVNLLRIRRNWAAIGQALQQPTCVDLFAGLERIHGRLTRVKDADRATQDKRDRRRR